MSLANISLVGNLVRQPEQMYFASGKTKTTIVLAINNPPKNGRNVEKADFYRVETWGKLAELAAKYLDKGNQVGICGRLVLDHWTDKTGKDRVTPVVEATQISLPPKAKYASGQDAQGESANGNPIGGEVMLPDLDSVDSIVGDSAAEPDDDSSYRGSFAAGDKLVAAHAGPAEAVRR